MKILVMQLARFGDIFQTWPVVKSLKRNYPNAELHFLCRQTFSGAISPLNCLDKVLKLDVEANINYILENTSDDSCTSKITSYLDSIKDENYDQIINLSYSPLSSYVASYVSDEKTDVRGLTRHEDGALDIPDDPSALIYGQLGVYKFNRIHLTRLFSAVAGVDLLEEDWGVSEAILAEGALRITKLPKRYLSVHIGGSTSEKLLFAQQWSELLNKLAVSNPELSFVLLGSSSEKEFSEKIIIDDSARVVNLVGETQLTDLFYIIEKSKALVAPDSSLLHIASLLDKQTINLSFSNVNFWETGPLSKNSYVIWNTQPSAIVIDQVASSIDAILSGRDVEAKHAKLSADSSVEAYDLVGYEDNNFQWNLIKAIYLGESFPVLDDMKVYTALKQLSELTDMVLRDLEMVRSGQFQNIQLEIVNNVDQLIHTLEKLVPEIRPIIWWFNTERLRIGPWDDQVVFDRNYDVFNQLRSLLAVYVGTTMIAPQLPLADEAPAL